MGKQKLNILLSLTGAFLTFLLGFYTGRNYNSSPVQISPMAVNKETLSVTQSHLTTMETTDLPESKSATEPAVETSVNTVPVTEPPMEAVTPTEKPTSPAETKSDLININTASAAQLETLPGIGEVLAQRIVEYRNTYGPFKSVYALTNVKGIGEKRLAAVIHLITV